jgi:hypothetical protein
MVIPARPRDSDDQRSEEENVSARREDGVIEKKGDQEQLIN